MKTWLIAVAIVALAACGVETATTAATSAEITSTSQCQASEPMMSASH